jgi:membrane protein YqaA with SNARE-associated domain
MEQEATPERLQPVEPAVVASSEAGFWPRLRWRLRQLPTGAVLGVGILVILALAGVVSFIPLFLGVSSEDMESLGYPGVFLANFIGTATLFFPVPGLTAAGQVLIVTLSDSLDRNLVAFLGGAGMASAELTAYAAGRGLRELSAERDMPIRGGIGRWLQKAASMVDWLMLHYGIATLFVLSAIPNPLFEFAGVTAGAVRMNIWKFFTPVVLGKMLRAFLLAYLGQRFLDLIT